MTTKEAEEWVETLNKSESFKWKDPNFHTECWHLTLLAHHLSILPCIRRYQRRLRAISKVQKLLDVIQKQKEAFNQNQQLNNAIIPNPISLKSRIIQDDYNTLAENVSIVFHSAATLKNHSGNNLLKRCSDGFEKYSNLIFF